MGSITIDGSATHFDDRLLVHLQIVIVQLLRQHQGILLSWANALAVGNGRTSVWVHPEAHIRFTFDGSRAQEIDPEWLELLRRSAESAPGLVVSDSDGAVVRSTGGAR